MVIPFIKNILWKSKKIQNIRKLYLEFSGSFFYFCLLYFKIKKIYESLEIKNYSQAISSAQRIIGLGHEIGFFYKAKVHFLYGEDQEARKILEGYLANNGDHTDAVYLYSDVLFFLKEKEIAWKWLTQLLSFSTRGKTWQYLAKFVDTKKDFNEYCDLLTRYYQVDPDKLPIDILEHLTNAAYRSGQQEKVVDIWQKKYLLNKNGLDNESGKSNSYSGYNAPNAEEALLDLKKVLDENKITFFLISGSLLGCIREGRLLSHDKDIDLGIWQETDIPNLIEMIRRAGCFYILPSTNADIVVIRHISGITIDIFIHYKSDNDYYHQGVKSSWHNIPFELSEYPFLNSMFFIPKNYDLYLTENYGEWIIPQPDFDSALDTPNMKVLDNNMMRIYLYKKMLFENKNSHKYEQFINTLREQ